MVQNNKVLTVSYGTFSCTLEGFDDSFDTMKSIAEYFRDLAADDRYFGSEPPQPDAEMLTHIAQRDRLQRVEARHNESGLLLRASDGASPAALGAPEKTTALSVHKDQTPVPHATDPFFAGNQAAQTPPAPANDSIAAKLQRIRAVVSHSDTTPTAYTEDEDAPLLNNAGPVDAVSAAFEAGALSPEDMERGTSAPAPKSESANMPIKAPTRDVTTTSINALFTGGDDAADAEDPDMRNIVGGDDDAAEQDALSADDEVNLLNEISAIEKEMSARPTAAAQSDLDQDVSRLMDKVGEQLRDPSTSDARETYSHLRSAAAAAAAEQAEGNGPAKEDEDYRDDLASVVSPRRPEIQVTSMRPETTTSPLKLVAEQRIDTPETDLGPVTPRRVTTQTQDSAGEESGFAQFAQEQGAQSLQDLLEAAASYLSFIEGQEQFSRPQLMNKVRSLKQDEFNREESLRSFGQLLRDGKIEKAGGGRFAASQQIGFRPQDERAAG